MDAQRLRAGPRGPARGFSFVDLLVSLAILIALVGTGVPGLNDLVQRTRATRQMLELRGLLELARQTAVLDQVDVTVCGTTDGVRCGVAWRAQPTLMFVDANANRSLDAGERLLAISRLTDTGQIDWRGSNGRRYLRFRPSGGVKEFGTFFYCPPDGNLRHSRALVVSATGHLRETGERGHFGPAVDAYGQAIICPR